MTKYPGLGLPLKLNYEDVLGHYPIGIHSTCDDSLSGLITVREVAMMNVMDRLMDKPDWHKKVFNDEIISKWRREALEIPDDYFWTEATWGKEESWLETPIHELSNFSEKKPLEGILSPEAFDYCIEELRNKARYYESSGLVRTLEAYATIVKSDSLVSSGLKASLRKAFQTLQTDQASSPDWHPNSDEKVQNLVHPSLYGLVYGRSRVFQDEVVGVADAIEKFSGKGEILEEHRSREKGGNAIRPFLPDYCWSDTYQWLPSNITFQDDGSVRFTSYVNNLHPTKYPEIYRALEKLVETALPAWDQCLHPRRLGARFPKPKDASDGNWDNWDPPEPEFDEISSSSHDSQGPGSDKDGEDDEHDGDEHDDDEHDDDEYDDEDYDDDDDDDEDYDEDEYEAKIEEWKGTRKAVQPSPPPFKERDYAPTRRLAQEFKNSGLQIIVKMVSIELTPEKPDFPMGGWHVEGQMNERICATALYYLDSENITPSYLSYRMQTPENIHEEFEDVGQYVYSWLERVYGTKLDMGQSPCLQNYGSVETRQDRLLAFPNVFHHRVLPFRLADPTKPGHRRFVALWLVDPHVRIMSTANVPPQRLDWWLESVLAGLSAEERAKAISRLSPELTQILAEKAGLIVPKDGEGAEWVMRFGTGAGAGTMPLPGRRLPPELMDMLRACLDANRTDTLMGDGEAKKHRSELMAERSVIRHRVDYHWHVPTYNFCEH